MASFKKKYFLILLDPKKVDLTWMILFDDLRLGTGFDRVSALIFR